MTTFGVVLCPNCKRPKGVKVENKTATCICGKRLNLSDLRVLYRTDDPLKLSEAIGRIAARLEGKEEEFIEGLLVGEEEVPEVAAIAVEVSQHRERAVVILQGLGGGPQGFTLEDAREIFTARGLGSPEPWFERLLRENVIYEPRRGVYKLV